MKYKFRKYNLLYVADPNLIPMEVLDMPDWMFIGFDSNSEYIELTDYMIVEMKKIFKDESFSDETKTDLKRRIIKVASN